METVAEWTTLLSNVGVGGGLAFFFSWYLLRSLIPSLNKINEEQRDAFLASIKEHRTEFISALRELKFSQERTAEELKQGLSRLTTEVEKANTLIIEFGKGKGR